MSAAIGLAIVAATLAGFWRALPREGWVHPLVGTQWEPYFAIVFVFGVTFGLGLVVVGLAAALI